MLEPPLVLARRSLMGLSIGDAFGETMFGEPSETARRAAKRLISPRRPWRWTDDTAIAATGEDQIPMLWCAATESVPDPLEL